MCQRQCGFHMKVSQLSNDGPGASNDGHPSLKPSNLQFENNAIGSAQCAYARAPHPRP